MCSVLGAEQNCRSFYWRGESQANEVETIPLAAFGRSLSQATRSSLDKTIESVTLLPRNEGLSLARIHRRASGIYSAARTLRCDTHA